MSYLNRFIIEEDNQFECNAIIANENLANFDCEHCDSKEAIFHCIFAYDYELEFNFADLSFDKWVMSIMKSPEEIMISRVSGQRWDCVQKENYQKFYREGGQVNTTTFWRPESGVHKYKTGVYKSIGDDIEDFYNRIKMKKVKLINQTYGTTNECWQKIIASIALNPSSSLKFVVRSFHLSMLTEQEESEICSIGTKYIGGHQRSQFRNKTAISRNSLNFALSFCSRKTYYIQCDRRNRKRILFDIDELDPWQEMIIKNHQESKLVKENNLKKARFNLWVPDSDSELESE